MPDISPNPNDLDRSRRLEDERIARLREQPDEEGAEDEGEEKEDEDGDEDDSEEMTNEGDDESKDAPTGRAGGRRPTKPNPRLIKKGMEIIQARFVIYSSAATVAAILLLIPRLIFHKLNHDRTLKNASDALRGQPPGSAGATASGMMSLVSPKTMLRMLRHTRTLIAVEWFAIALAIAALLIAVAAMVILTFVGYCFMVPTACIGFGLMMYFQ